MDTNRKGTRTEPRVQDDPCKEMPTPSHQERREGFYAEANREVRRAPNDIDSRKCDDYSNAHASHLTAPWGLQINMSRNRSRIDRMISKCCMQQQNHIQRETHRPLVVLSAGRDLGGRIIALQGRIAGFRCRSRQKERSSGNPVHRIPRFGPQFRMHAPRESHTRQC